MRAPNMLAESCFARSVFRTPIWLDCRQNAWLASSTVKPMRWTLYRNHHECNNTVMDLPADLRLPLKSGAPWWYWLGGRPALDFVNTRRERWWRDVETLVTPGD